MHFGWYFRLLCNYTGERGNFFYMVLQNKLCCYLSLINQIALLIFVSALVVMNVSWIWLSCSNGIVYTTIQCSRIRILRFLRFQKHDFLRFLEMYQKVVSHKNVSSLLNVYRNFGVKTPDVMGAYRRLSRTVLSCIVSSVCTSGQDVWCWWHWLITYQYWLPVIE